jgi:S-DNA-T family DNA segregation ATPase FtsK/SpoIIIE
VGSIFESHAEDVWGIVLLTTAVLGALALYGDALGPVGQGLRHGLGSFLGVGRFVVPLGCAGAGVILVVGPFQQEKVRVGIGLVLTVISVSGLADIAGGAPRLTASSATLAGAGGWVGIAAGGPLRHGIGGWGASVVLIAVLILALVLFTGVTLRRAATAVAQGASDLWRALVPEVDEDESDVTGAEGQAPRHPVPAAPELFDVALSTAPADPAEKASVEKAVAEPDPAAALAHDDDPAPLSTVGGRVAVKGAGDELEVDLGMPAGEWRLPPPRSLSRSKQQQLDHAEVAVAGRALVDALAAHGVATRLVGNTIGPTVTRFELELGPGVKVARVTSLAKDIAYAMASPDVRILAPIPGKSAIGVEVPNRRRQLVTLGDVLASDEARSATHPLEVALGRDIAGRAVMASLAEMPHILISGATGAGKSSCINSLITSILMRATPEQVRLILVDPKRVELGQYNGLPHLLTQVVVDPKKAANALSWAVTEMERRYDILAEAGMRDIDGYNEALDRDELGTTVCGPDDDEGDVDELDEGFTAHDGEGTGDDGSDDVDIVSEAADIVSAAEARAAARVEESRAVIDPPIHRERLPYVLIVVDELNDLMMVAARDVEESVCRIAQMARAVGIHLVLATQRPSVDVITGVIKANVPSRLAFSVSSLADSRVILDQPGAERLVGKGDMLLLTASSSVARRIQGPWVAESEVRSVVAHWRRQHQPQYVEGLAGEGGSRSGGGGVEDDDDDLLPAAMEMVVRSQLGSTSMLQRKLRVGFSRAGRLMDLLERRGVVGPSEGSKARAVLMTPEEYEQLSER